MHITYVLVLKFIDTAGKRRFMFSIVIFYPLLSLLVGAPLPFPSLLDVTPDQIAIFNFMSLLITIMGSIVGVGFYLERRQNLKLEAHNQKIKDVEKKIEEAVILTHQDNKDLRHEMKEMETRLQVIVASKNSDIEKIVEHKVTAAKELVDTRFKNIEEIAKGMQKSIDFMQQFQFGSGAKSVPPFIQGRVESQQHKDQPYEGIYQTPDSTETQKHKDKQERIDKQEYKDFQHDRDKERIQKEKDSKKRWVDEERGR